MWRFFRLWAFLFELFHLSCASLLCHCLHATVRIRRSKQRSTQVKKRRERCGDTTVNATEHAPFSKSENDCTMEQQYVPLTRLWLRPRHHPNGPQSTASLQAGSGCCTGTQQTVPGLSTVPELGSIQRLLILRHALSNRPFATATPSSKRGLHSARSNTPPRADSSSTDTPSGLLFAVTAAAADLRPAAATERF